jgi:alkylhydroperoxidase family enzyme
VLENYQTAPISPAEKALFAFIEKVNRNSPAIRESDTERVRQAGWTDEAIYDAINVCALFNFYNRWIDAAGVHEMSPESHRLSGRRLAKFGYVMADAKVTR